MQSPSSLSQNLTGSSTNISLSSHISGTDNQDSMVNNLNIDVLSPRNLSTPNLGFITPFASSSSILDMSTEMARDALIQPLLAENNREEFAIILANTSQSMTYRFLYGIIFLISGASLISLWLDIMPFNKDEANSAGSTLNLIAIIGSALLFAITLTQQIMIAYLDVDFKKQARQLLLAFNEGINAQIAANEKLKQHLNELEVIKNNLNYSVGQLEKANLELNINIESLNASKIELMQQITNLNSEISNLNTENQEYKKNNSHLKESIHSLDMLIQNTTSEVSRWMNIALKEDENSKEALKNLQSQLQEAAEDAAEGYHTFLGIASNLQGVRKELADLTNKNKALTTEYRSVLSEIIKLKDNLTEQTYLDRLRQLGRQLDYFADQGGKQILSTAIREANENKSDTISIPKVTGDKLSSFLIELDHIFTEADSVLKSESLTKISVPLCELATKRCNEIDQEKNETNPDANPEENSEII